jgi:hypothetical protein
VRESSGTATVPRVTGPRVPQPRGSPGGRDVDVGV